LDTQTKELPGRNEPCHCGSGKKYKNCHLDADEKAARAARTKAAEATKAEPSAEAAAASGGGATAGASSAPPRGKGHAPQPWKRGTANTRGFQRTSATRKVGGGG